MAQTTFFSSFNDLWSECKRWGIVTGSSATTATQEARELAVSLTRACGMSIGYSGTMAQSAQSKKFQRNPTTA
jgi:hypothetical protein